MADGVRGHRKRAGAERRALDGPPGELEAGMKNFLIGLALGWAAAYWYYTQGEYLHAVAVGMWARASAPPPGSPTEH